VSLDKNISINQRFSLPNKIFDYISAGIPVIAGDLREVTKIITDFDCGIVVPEITPGEISKTVKLLHENRDLLRKFKQNARKASEIINWNRESEKVSTFYESIINKK
jgi:glycosyltransferase involved in cell wall biosynthesis